MKPSGQVWLIAALVGALVVAGLAVIAVLVVLPVIRGEQP